MTANVKIENGGPGSIDIGFSRGNSNETDHVCLKPGDSVCYAVWAGHTFIITEMSVQTTDEGGGPG